MLSNHSKITSKFELISSDNICLNSKAKIENMKVLKAAISIIT